MKEIYKVSLLCFSSPQGGVSKEGRALTGFVWFSKETVTGPLLLEVGMANSLLPFLHPPRVPTFSSSCFLPPDSAHLAPPWPPAHWPQVQLRPGDTGGTSTLEASGLLQSSLALHYDEVETSSRALNPHLHFTRIMSFDPSNHLMKWVFIFLLFR